jgi:hypothetical protein
MNERNKILTKKLKRLFNILIQKGILHAMYWGLVIIGEKLRIRTITPASFVYFYRGIKFKPYFVLANKKYKYLYHRHNYTWCTEREVEIPIAWEIVRKYKSKKILEVGNVLNGYYNLKHDVLDKYEIAANVINEDVVKFCNGKKYDLIISISTLEHVGWDEPKRDRQKIPRAINNLKSMLSKDGVIFFTVPLGYNLYLDNLLHKNKIKLSETHFLKRISIDNKWIEVPWNTVKNSRFGYPYEAANAIMIGIIRN